LKSSEEAAELVSYFGISYNLITRIYREYEFVRGSDNILLCLLFEIDELWSAQLESLNKRKQITTLTMAERRLFGVDEEVRIKRVK
jgi:hypothetical protein